MKGAKLSNPGRTDDTWMLVTCAPADTRVEFFEFREEAERVMRENTMPSTTCYLGQVVRQSEHRVRGNATHHALFIEVDITLKQQLAEFFHLRRKPTRKDITTMLMSFVQNALALVRQPRLASQAPLPPGDPVEGP